MKAKYFTFILWGIIVLGAVFRVGQYAYNRSLTEGEAPLAINIQERSYTGLARPLSYVQAAPVAFLFLQKFMSNTFGNNELALRFIPLIAGILALGLFIFAARMILKGYGLLTALALFAVNDQAIYFASELKQYSSDVFFSTALLLLGLWIMKKGYTAVPLLIFGLLSGIAVWFSHPSVFVSAALFGVVLAAVLHGRHTGSLPWLALAAAIALGSGIADYLVNLAAASRQEALVSFWQRSFVPLPPRSFADLGRTVFAVIRIFKNPGGFSVYDALIAACAFLVGLVVLWRTEKKHALVLILPVLLAFFASGFHIYPFEGRLLLFIVPFIVLLTAAGADKTREVISRSSRAGGVLAVALILAYPAGSACYHLIRPRAPEELRPVLAVLSTRKAADEAVYVYYGAVNAYKYYAPRYGFAPGDFIPGAEARDDWSKYYGDLKKLASGGRVKAWVVMSHISTWNGVDEEKLFVSYLDRLGKRLDVIRAPGAVAYLYGFFTEQDNEDHSDN